MSEEMSNVNGVGSGDVQEKSFSVDTISNTGQNFTGKNNQENSSYPQSYGTEIANKEKNQMQNNTGKPHSSQNARMQNMYDKGTLLTSPINGVQHTDEYDFEFSDGTYVDDDLTVDFKNFALNKQMSVETAKQVASFYEDFMQKTNANQSLNDTIMLNNFNSACQNDVEFGGAKLHENIRHAKAAINRFDDGTLSKILTETGFGSHPEVVRFLYRVGKSLSEKSMVMGQGAQQELSTAELFYPSMRKG